MAKIGTAQVETIHIPDGAISEYATISGSTDSSHFGNRTFSGSVVNDAASPVELWLQGSFEVDSASGTTVQGTGTLSVTRNRDGAVLYSDSYSHSTKGQSTEEISAQIFDTTAQANEAYTLTIGASKSGGTLSSDKSSLNATVTLIAARK